MIVAAVALLVPMVAASETVLVPIAVAVVPVPISIFCNSYASQLPSYVVHIVQLRLLGCKQGNWLEQRLMGSGLVCRLAWAFYTV